MRKSLGRIATLKMIDLGIQAAAFIVMLFCFPLMGPFALFVMGVTHLLSFMFWSMQRDLPVPRFRRHINPVIAVISVIVLSSTVSIPMSQDPLDGAFGVVCLAMFFIGPILGIWYFAVTAREILWYKRAALPSYQ